MKLLELQPMFQRAPTLEGECYDVSNIAYTVSLLVMFQRAPTLEGECYGRRRRGGRVRRSRRVSTGTHP